MTDGWKNKEVFSHIVDALDHLSFRIFIPYFLRALIGVCHHLHQSHCHKRGLTACFCVQVQAPRTTLIARIFGTMLKTERMNDLP